jgi:hypothetical protein
MSIAIKSTPSAQASKISATADHAPGPPQALDQKELEAVVQQLTAGIVNIGLNKGWGISSWAPSVAGAIGTGTGAASATDAGSNQCRLFYYPGAGSAAGATDGGGGWSSMQDSPAARQMAQVYDQPVQLTEQKMQTVATLHKYEDQLLAELNEETLAAIANDPNQPAELRQACQALLDDPALFRAMDSAAPAQGLSGESHNLDDGILTVGDINAAYNDEQMAVCRDREWMLKRNQTLSAMVHHADLLPDTLTQEQCAELAQDTSLPPDLRQAYANLAEDPSLFGDLDTASQHGALGGDASLRNGEIGTGDYAVAFRDPYFSTYQREQSKFYTHNYIPSDAKDDELTPREMCGSDASRELYLYAESLPNDIGREELERIARGEVGPDCKNPAQLQAAAQYMLDHPDEWERMAPGGKVNRDDLQNNLVAYMHLTSDESEAVGVLAANKDWFLREGGWVTRDSLTRLTTDESAPPEVRKAAQTLLDSPVIFGQLDNGLFGHHSSLSNRTFDGMFGGDDIDNYLRKLETYKPPPPPPPAPPPPPPPDPVPTETEVDAVHTIQENSEACQDEEGNITKESLQRVADDQSQSSEVREAALLLLASPALFKTLDGAGADETGAGRKNQDGKITSADLGRFDVEVQHRRQKADEYAAWQRQQAHREAAQADMLAGRDDDPEIRKACGGAETITGPLARVLNVIGKVLDVVKTGLDIVAGLLPPPFGAIVAGIGAGVAGVNNFAVKTGEAMCNGVPPGEAFKEAGKDFGMDLAGSVTSMAPGGAFAGKAALQGGKMAMQTGGKVTGEAAEQGAKAGLREGADAGGKAAARNGAEVSDRTAGQVSGKGASEEAFEAGAKKASQESSSASPTKAGEMPKPERDAKSDVGAAPGTGKQGEPNKTGDKGKDQKKLKDDKDNDEKKDDKDNQDSKGKKDSKSNKHRRNRNDDRQDSGRSVDRATESVEFNPSTESVSNSINQGIQAGHEIAALMQRLSLAAAEDGATKKAGEQAKTAAQ